jgi:hypothetical protein
MDNNQYRRNAVNQLSHVDVALTPGKPHELAKLIRKLRWIGLDEEAIRLQQVVRSLPPEQRGSVLVGPFSTD